MLPGILRTLLERALLSLLENSQPPVEPRNKEGKISYNFDVILYSCYRFLGKELQENLRSIWGTLSDALHKGKPLQEEDLKKVFLVLNHLRNRLALPSVPNDKKGKKKL